MTQDEQDYKDYQDFQEYQRHSASGGAPAQQAPQAELAHPGDTLGNFAKGAADTAGTFITGALAEPLAGIAGVGSLLLNKGNVDKAAETIERTRQWATHSAWSAAGKYNEQEIGKLAEKAAPAFQALDDGIYAVAGENAELATALKTTLYGSASLLGVKGPKALGMTGRSLAETHAEARNASRLIARHSSDARKQLERHGITLTNDEVPITTVRKADKLAPDREQGANMDMVQKDVKAAEAIADTEVTRLYTEARNKKAFVNVPAIKQFASQMEADLLAKGHDLGGETMKIVRQRLNQLQDTDTVIPGSRMELDIANKQLVNPPPFRYSRISLKAIDVMEKRLSLDLKGAKPGEFDAKQQALYDVRKGLRGMIDDQVNKRLITGDMTAVDAWKDARNAYATYKKNFKSDKVIRDLVLKDGASPDQIYRWVIGASANGMKKEATRTIRRLNTILGPQHPSMQKVKMAVLRDVFEPVFGTEPNFLKAGANIDNLLKKNHSAVKELGIDTDELMAVRKGMRLSEEASDPFKWDWKPITAFVTREAIGNRLAKNAANLRLANKILNSAIRVGKLGQKDINRILAEQDFHSPMLTPELPGYRQTVREIALAGAAAEVADAGDWDEED